MNPTPSRPLVIGIGNPLRADDAIGFRAAEILTAMPLLQPALEIVAVHQLTPELAYAVVKAPLVFFIDAIVPSADRPPGSVRCEEITEAPPVREALGHHLTPAQLLGFAAALYEATPRAWVVSVAAETFEYRDSLSPAVADAIPAVVQAVRDRLPRDETSSEST